jgi:hypothetical protein
MTIAPDNPNQALNRTICTVILCIYGNRGAVPLVLGSERYGRGGQWAARETAFAAGWAVASSIRLANWSKLVFPEAPRPQKRARTSLRGGKSRVSIYSRVSTLGQDTDMQTTELREYCKRRGWDSVHEYSDQGVSGAKESRPELNRLIADAHKRRFDAVVVWRFDRFARSVSHLLRALEEFRSLGIEFVSLSEAVVWRVCGAKRRARHALALRRGKRVDARASWGAALRSRTA